MQPTLTAQPTNSSAEAESAKRPDQRQKLPSRLPRSTICSPLRRWFVPNCVFLTHEFRSGDGQLVAAFVLGMAGMTFHSSKRNLMFGQQLIQLLPQFDIDNGLEFAAFFAAPAVGFPTLHPGFATVGDIRTVGHDFDARAASQLFQTFNHGL